MCRMRLGERHAFLTRELADGRIVDVQPWRAGMATLVVSASRARWSYVAFYWYGSVDAAVDAALAWDGTGVPSGAGRCPRL
jgi:hypothetical protein